MWIARNRNNSLYMFYDKPYREHNWRWVIDLKDLNIMELKDEEHPQFKDLKWEDEPVEVNIFTNKFIQEFGDACYKQGEEDACHFEYGEYPEGNLTIEEYVASKNKAL